MLNNFRKSFFFHDILQIVHLHKKREKLNIDSNFKKIPIKTQVPWNKAIKNISGSWWWHLLIESYRIVLGTWNHNDWLQEGSVAAVSSPCRWNSRRDWAAGARGSAGRDPQCEIPPINKDRKVGGFCIRKINVY